LPSCSAKHSKKSGRALECSAIEGAYREALLPSGKQTVRPCTSGTMVKRRRGKL
jgi:hypothetical protein